MANADRSARRSPLNARAATTLVLSSLVAAACSGGARPNTIAHAPTTPACDAFFASTAVARLLADLGRLSAISSPPWAEYRAEAHTLVLVGPDRPAAATCALIWRGRELDRVAIAEPIPIVTGVFWYWAAEAPGPNALPEMRGLGNAMRTAPAELVAALGRANTTRAVLLRVDFDPAPLAGVDLAAHFGSTDVLRFLWAVHETFHLNSQFPTWLDQRPAYRWPAWDRQPSRTELVARCYGGKQAPLATDERTALLEAFTALYQRKDRRAACAAARRFRDARARRYASLTVEVASPSGPIGCEVAEATMELEEGGANYIAIATALDLELLRPAHVEISFREPIVDPFYAHGGTQLLILRGLLGPEAMRAATERIARSSDHRGGIGGELTAAIERSCR